MNQTLLTHHQGQLLSISQAVISRLFDTQQLLPCFGLLLHPQGQIQELLPEFNPGEEERAFESLLVELRHGIASGAIGTALVLLLEPPTAEDNTSGATVDLEQHGEQRFIGYIPFSVTCGRVTFEPPKLTAKPASLFCAP